MRNAIIVLKTRFHYYNLSFVIITMLLLTIVACGNNNEDDVEPTRAFTTNPITRPAQEQTPEPEGNPIEILTRNESILFNAILNVLSDFTDIQSVRISLIQNQYDDLLLNKPPVITLANDDEEHKYYLDLEDEILIFVKDPPVSPATYFGYRYNLDRLNDALEFHWEQ